MKNILPTLILLSAAFHLHAQTYIDTLTVDEIGQVRSISDLGYENSEGQQITGFRMVYVYRGENPVDVVNAGSLLSSRGKQLLETCRAGGVLYIENVKAKGADQTLILLAAKVIYIE